MDKWKVTTGEASNIEDLLDPYSVEFGPIRDYQELLDPYSVDFGPIQDYQEHENPEVSFGPAQVDPLVFGEAEMMDPWSVDIGQSDDVVEMGPAEVTGAGDFEVGNPDQEGSPYRVLIKKGRR